MTNSGSDRTLPGSAAVSGASAYASGSASGTLSGLNRCTARPRGGITKVELVPADSFAGAGSGPSDYIARSGSGPFDEISGAPESTTGNAMQNSGTSGALESTAESETAAALSGGAALEDTVLEDATLETSPPGTASSATSSPGVEYVFREDGARYSETLVDASGNPLNDMPKDPLKAARSSRPSNPLLPLVRHTLEMDFPAGPSTRRALDELLARSGAGFVAIVTTASGERLTVGCSARFGTAYPLRVTGLTSKSGSSPADLPAATLTLESIDADLSSDNL